MDNGTADCIGGAAVNNHKEKGSGMGAMLLIGLLFVPIHVGIFILLGKNNWLPLEFALIGAIVGVFRVWSENENTKDKDKLIEMAVLGLIQSLFIAVIVFGPFILLANSVIKNIFHIPILKDESPAGLKFVSLFLGFELFYWLAIYFLPKLEAKRQAKRKLAN